MGFVKIRNGMPFEGTIPKMLELPVAGSDGIGSILEEKSSEDEEALHRWMFREGYVPEDEWKEE